MPNTTAAILETIEKAGQQQASELIQSAKNRQADALAREKARVTEEVRQLTDLRFAEIRQETGRKICAAENEARATLFRRRETIRQEVFAKAKEAIVAFTKSDAYEAFLIACAEKIHTAMQGGCAVLNMREADRSFAAAVSARLGRSITLHIDPAITLGGITVISADGTMMIDDTLDSRLQQQEAWFMENSGMVID